ncbi:MAG: methyltransferase [Acidobacteriota bacterium]
MPNNPVSLWELSDLCTPWCVHVAATLRVAEQIEAGHHSVDALAAACACDARYLGLMLRHLVRKGVFEEPAPDTFALNDAAREFLDPGAHLGFDLDGLGGRMAHAWGTLLKAVRTGKPAYADVFGRGFWDDLEAHQEIAAAFDALMGPEGHGAPDPDVLLDADWSGIRSVVDVGGGTGSMLAEILRTHPDVRGTLVDQPNTVARASSTFAKAGVVARAGVVGQSFFDPLPAGADLYLLLKVVSNWTGHELVAILRRCGEAAGETGRIVIIGGVSADNRPQALTIETVLIGGMNHGLSEFRTIAADAGLTVTDAGTQASARFIVECRSAGAGGARP